MSVREARLGGWPLMQVLPRMVHAVGQAARSAVRRIVPAGAAHWLDTLWLKESLPRAGHVRWGDLRRLTPISRRWGKDRGSLPIDRFYVERFLAACASDIAGRVLEVQDARYTLRFGGERVTHSDVLHVVPGNPAATMVGDLVFAPEIPTGAFDCVILTQVLHCIEDVQPAIRTVHRILRPGGVALVTVPGISQVSLHDMERWGDCWRFTSLTSRRLFERAFSPGEVEVKAHGNVLAAVAFLHGLASEELHPDELSYNAPDYEVLITIRAVKASPIGGNVRGGSMNPSSP